MSDRCLGIFDSGLGGLTVLKEILRYNVYDRIVYFGDTGRVPYGTRSKQTIIKYSMQDVRFLLSKGAGEIIVACGTASANALDELQAGFDVPVTGVIDVSARAAVAATRNRRIGVIGTNATIDSHVYPDRIAKLDPACQVYCQPCPLFVPLVEYGFAAHPDDTIVSQTVAFYLQDLKTKGIDTLILGCTHYPILKDYIGHFLGNAVTLVNSGVELAKQAVGPLVARPQVEYYVSDGAASFSRNGSAFMGPDEDLKAADVDIQRF